MTSRMCVKVTAGILGISTYVEVNVGAHVAEVKEMRTSMVGKVLGSESRLRS
jgi:hypothetical protein